MLHLKNTILGTGLFALAVLPVACSSDSEDNEPTPAKGAIAFTGIVPGATKGAPTTTASIENFIVYAFTAGKPYMENVRVSRNGGQWTYSPLAYWPSTPVNFFAFSPDISNTPGITTSGLGEIANYTNHGTTDLLYAVNMGETAREAPVQMNFRHAMANIKVLISSGNPSIVVKVANISLTNVALRGSFKFPQATTSATLPGNIGSWSNLSLVGPILTYYSFAESDFKTLTETPTDLTLGNLEVSFMIPQDLAQLEYDGTAYTGNAIQVDCEIYDAASGARIWPTGATPSSQLVAETNCGRLMYPVTAENVKSWEAGHSYIYNIIIDNPSVLHPINFNVTVDEYDEITVD